MRQKLLCVTSLPLSSSSCDLRPLTAFKAQEKKNISDINTLLSPVASNALTNDFNSETTSELACTTTANQRGWKCNDFNLIGLKMNYWAERGVPPQHSQPRAPPVFQFFIGAPNHRQQWRFLKINLKSRNNTEPVKLSQHKTQLYTYLNVFVTNCVYLLLLGTFTVLFFFTPLWTTAKCLGFRFREESAGTLPHCAARGYG